MNKCLNNKRLDLERAKIYFYFASAFFTIVAALGNRINLWTNMLNTNDIPSEQSGAILFIGILTFMGIAFLILAMDHFTKQK